MSLGNDVLMQGPMPNVSRDASWPVLAHELMHVAEGDRATVYRYEAYEHATVGDTAAGSVTTNINGVDLTSGEINALGDLYETLADLNAAPPSELRALRDLVRKQKANPASVSEADWDRASGNRYTKLNLRNSPHFGPRNPALIGPGPSATLAGPDNRSIWEAAHRRALGLARSIVTVVDPVARRPVLDKAAAENAFGEHFLVDAFSAGHLFSKQDLMSVSSANLAGLSSSALDSLFDRIVTLAWPSAGPTVRQYQGKKGIWWQLDAPGRFKSVLQEVYADPDGKDALNGAIAKAAHDRLSKQTDSAGNVGVPVENDFEAWTLSGDKTLAKSPTTQKWIQKAIETGRANVQVAATTLVAAADADLVKLVMRYLPRTTTASTPAVAATLKELSDPKAKLVEAVASVIGAEADALMKGIVARKPDKVRFHP